MKKSLLLLCVGIFASAFAISPALAKKRASAATGTGRAGIPERSGSPYLGAIVVNAETGDVVFEDNPDVECYPASIIKLMDLLIIQEQIEAKSLKLTDQVSVNADTSRIGGSQVYLKENESFTVEELLYALMVQSANDAAAALALRIAGSTDAFVTMMQQKADALGMSSTKFHSVHGLPPPKGEEPDVSTPRDLTILARELLKHPDILRYTSTAIHAFRNDTMVMQNHNKLLGTFVGCDGLKTGYFRLGGYSIVATAQRGGNRFIAVIVGAKEKKVRDAKAKELLSQAFAKVTPKPAVTPQVQASLIATPSLSGAVNSGEPGQKKAGHVGKRIFITLIVILLIGSSFWLGRKSTAAPKSPPGIRYELKK
ncbi:MAG: D-alanyl-D-alanine carboxypeptidase [Candidatus Aureabacteria bacterium]|nr:D-alanyl-D-alanine carboxypeptidase [Candidatus Auribacterota bacterium]